LKRLLFFIGFLLGMTFFVVSNIYAHNNAGAPCDDCSFTFGFPFPLGRAGGFAGGTHFIISGLFLDSVVAVVSSLLFARLLAMLLPPLVDSFRQAGHWHMKTRS
jgi:hypothetical protein